MQKLLDKLNVELEKQKEKLDAKMDFIAKIDSEQDSRLAQIKQAIDDSNVHARHTRALAAKNDNPRKRIANSENNDQDG